MDEGYEMAVMQGVVVYIALLGLFLFGGLAYWFRFRILGVGLIVGSAALLVWFIAGAPLPTSP